MKTEKLELAHLAAYLPYGLKVMRGDGIQDRLCGIMFSDDTDYRNTKETYHNIEHPLANLETHTVEFEDIKPLLRPLSELYSTDGFSLSNMISHGYHNTFWSEEKFSVKHIYYHDLAILLEWHFDVFGLIESGLAIKI